MFRDGYIYRGKRLVNWDAHLQTSVADDETYTEDTKGQFWTFKYPVVGEPDTFIRFSTTRPETMLGDTAVCVHPSDERYKALVGKRVKQVLNRPRNPDHRGRPTRRPDPGHRVREGDARARPERLRLLVSGTPRSASSTS